MIENPYDTTACRAYNTATSVKQLKELQAMGGEQVKTAPHPTEKDSYLFGLKILTNGPAVVAPFAHPLIVESSWQSEDRTKPNTVVYLDVRNCTRSKPDGEFTISNEMDFKMAIYRGLFQRHLNESIHGGGGNLQNLGTFPLTVYARWVQQSLTRVLAIAPEHQVRVTILAAYFYLSMFRTPDASETELSERDKVRFGQLISRGTYMNVADVIKIIDDLPIVRNSEDFVNLLINHSGSLRFEEGRFNLPFLYTAICGSWFGTNARELLAVAFEHMPTWMAICAMATQERGLQKTGIGEIVRNFQKGDDIKTFLYNVKHLTEN